MPTAKEVFESEVALKYKLYNSLFLTLPFSDLSRYGSQLPLLAQLCAERLEAGDPPDQIVGEFLRDVVKVKDTEQDSLLFLFLQLIERQVVLFDAVEAAAHEKLYAGGIEELLEQLTHAVDSERCLRIVLTAHPTQFYPESLLGIIHDLTAAVANNEQSTIRKLLLQLGRTAFRSGKQPTPLEEAEMLIDRFTPRIMEVFVELTMRWREQQKEAPRLEIGFWPGGDRDGHPLVTVETTRAVIRALRERALRFHLEQMERLRRRITFKGSVSRVAAVRSKLQLALRGEGGYTESDQALSDLLELRQQVVQDHEALFVEEIDRAIVGIELFGFFLASLDIRQASDVHGKMMGEEYLQLDEEQRIAWLMENEVSQAALDEVGIDLLNVMELVPEIHRLNGQRGCHRFIISHAARTSHILEAMLISKGALEIVPLFESIADLKAAPAVMERLLQLPYYQKRLDRFDSKQTVMLGFSDGTKDGGYVACNWAIQQCKEQLHALGTKEGVEFIFFDGRGGPPARGGGHTHKYYAAVAERIPLREIQLTVQGQSISSFYGTSASARHNILQLLSAFTVQPNRVDEDDLLAELADRSFQAYQTLRQDPKFIPLLVETTPLTLLGDLNIASRPQKRSAKKELSLENLRAISFVGAWALMKVNLPAFYGLGLTLEAMASEGKLEALQSLYLNSSFFRALMGNAGQALRKTYEPLTRYLENDPEYGSLWHQIRDELARSKRLLREVSGEESLMGSEGVGEASVALREELILPLLVIQHDALISWRRNSAEEASRKRLLKSIPASINASRNSA